MDKSRFVEEAFAILNEHHAATAGLASDSTAVKEQQLTALDKLLFSYKQCQEGGVDTEDERFSVLDSCLQSVLHLSPAEGGNNDSLTAKRLYAFSRFETLADPYMFTYVDQPQSVQEEQPAVVEEEPQVSQEVEAPAEADSLFVNNPEIEEEIERRGGTKSTGWMAGFVFKQKSAHHNLGIDHMIGQDGRNKRIKAECKAFELGLTEEQCEQIGKEVSTKYLEDYYMGNSRGAEEYLLFSKTFRESPEGRQYLADKGIELSAEQLHKFDVADRLRADLSQDFALYSSGTERMGESYDLFVNNKLTSIARPTDMGRADDAMNTALKLGFSKSQAKNIANEVFVQSDKRPWYMSVLNWVTGTKAPTQVDYLRNSPTFMADPKGQRYMSLVQVNKELDQVLGLAPADEGLDIGQTKTTPMVAQAENPAMAAAPLITQQLSSLDQSQTTYMGAPGVSQRQANDESQQRKTGMAAFFSSSIGMVVTMIIFFFIAKMTGANALMSGLIAGGGGLAMPFLSNLLGQSLGSTNTAGVGGPSILGQAEQHYAMVDAQKQQLDITNQRNIQDGMAEQQTIQVSDQEMLAVLKEQGFAGLRTYLGNNEQLFNSFVTQHNLADLAKNEAVIRFNNGDWLKATQSALSARENLAMVDSPSTTNSLKMNV